MPIFGIDASSAQGVVDWATADRVTAFGAEKVSEGLHYVNPFWPEAKAAMTAASHASGFVSIAYLFMRPEDGAAQADWFAEHAGDLDGFGIAVDFERAPQGPPTIAQARACVARMRQHYPHHPIGLYAPHWFTGGQDLTFGDWLWASNYVSASGMSPAALYGHVRDEQWAAYGGVAPVLLQFTDAAVVPGVRTRVDCSAFKGVTDELREIVLPSGKSPAHHRKVISHVTEGSLSLSGLVAKHEGLTEAQVVRLTAQHSPHGGKFEGNVAAWLNGIFRGDVDPAAPMPEGLKLWLPA